MLRRGLGSIQIQLISLGGIVGSAYFLGIGEVVAENGVFAILAFILGGLIVWLVSMAMGELCVGMMREGSFIAHSAELIGKPWAAGVGWSYWFNWCAYIPSEMVAGGFILHQFLPEISVMAWATCFAVLITAVNLLQVKYLGWIESFLAFLKIGAMIGFIILAGMIWFCWIGTPCVGDMTPSLAKVVYHVPPQFGIYSFLATMVLVLVNFQGTELIALSAAEATDPERSIPKATRNVVLRTVLLFVLPLSMLILIFPAGTGSVEKSSFVEALSHHGLLRVAGCFQAVIVMAALSCANSGLYGATRSLYSLGKLNLGPRAMTKVSAQGVPHFATWMTIAVSWSFLPLYIFFEGSQFYTWLLGVSGFTGAICWISISWCQIQFRNKIRKESGSEASLLYKMPLFPYLSGLAVVLQLMCLMFMVFHPTLRQSLILGIPAFAIPFVGYWCWERCSTTRMVPKFDHLERFM